jgi:hypothetical protein
MNKRGQFFLIAAMVIIGILFGLSAIYTTIDTPPEDSFVYDLSKEINFEAGSVIDQGVFFSINEEERNSHVENLTDYYSAANLGTDLVIVYGNKTEMVALFYTSRDTGSVSVDFGGNPLESSFEGQRKYRATFVPESSSNTITITLPNNLTFTFEIKPGQTFFVVLKKVKQGEQFVSTSRES